MVAAKFTHILKRAISHSVIKLVKFGFWRRDIMTINLVFTNLKSNSTFRRYGLVFTTTDLRSENWHHRITNTRTDWGTISYRLMHGNALWHQPWFGQWLAAPFLARYLNHNKMHIWPVDNSPACKFVSSWNMKFNIYIHVNWNCTRPIAINQIKTCGWHIKKKHAKIFTMLCLLGMSRIYTASTTVMAVLLKG